MGSEAHTGARPAIAVAAAGLIIAGCAASGAGTHERSSPSLRLVAYDNCSDLLSGLRTATSAHVGPYGLSDGQIARPLTGGRLPADGVPAQKSTGYTGTNVQEPGVDEPDMVKTDGRRIVTVSGGSLRVVDAASREQTGTLPLADDRGWASDDLLMSGDRVLVIMRPTILYPRDDIGAPRRPAQDEGPRAVLVDLKAAPRVVASMRIDGSYLDARQTGSVARLVVRSTPDIAFPQRPQGTRSADATAANRAIVKKAPLDAWLPRYTVTRAGRTQQEKVPCGQVSHPPSFTGTSFVSVLSVDLSGDMADAAPVSVAAGGQTVYGSPGALYVTDRVSQDAKTPPDAKTLLPVQARTDIYRFDLTGTPGRPRFTASGSVPGDLLGQYSLSEYQGNLRVATTTSPSAQRPGDQTASTSTVYVLGRHGARLDRIGSIGGLGRGERIYAVRFIGPVGYVVTFRQTDPLYTIDLRDPAHPKTTGQLKISGYSAYLHPAGDGRLIGVGQETDAKGRPKGTQVSLFDVSDPAAPKKIDGYKPGSSWSAAEFDPHAFLYEPRTGLTVLPSAGDPKDGATVLNVSSSRITKAGSVSRSDGVQRSLLVGGTLWTLSPAGLQANDAKSLHKTGWVAF